MLCLLVLACSTCSVIMMKESYTFQIHAQEDLRGQLSRVRTSQMLCSLSPSISATIPTSLTSIPSSQPSPAFSVTLAGVIFSAPAWQDDVTLHSSSTFSMDPLLYFGVSGTHVHRLRARSGGAAAPQYPFPRHHRRQAWSVGLLFLRQVYIISIFS